MLPSEQLQKYMVRAVTGFGERVQAQDVSEQDLQEAGAKISTLAGWPYLLLVACCFLLTHYCVMHA